MELSISPILVTGITAFIVAFLVYSIFKKDKGHSNSQKCQHTEAAPEEYDVHTEVVVVGAGIVGCAIGAALSRDGRKVTIIERDLSEPNRIVGELLQPGGYVALTKLGLKDAVENIDAHVVYGYVIHDNDSGNTVSLSYPLDENKAVMTGRSFHHGRFVMGLRKEARKCGATLIEGTAVSLLESQDGNIVGVSYKDKTNQSHKAVKADLTIIADGCFSKFRKDFSTSSVTVSSHFAGIIMHDCPQFKKGHAEIILSPNGPILVYQISSTATRILVDIQGKMPSNMNQYLKEEVAPLLTEIIRKPFQEALEKEGIRSMPNSFLPARYKLKPGVLLMGDSFNMRHPLTGSGMSVALNDALLLKELLFSVSDLKNSDQVLSLQKRFLWQRKQSHSFVVNVLAQALYALFSASDRNLYDLRRACFEYFKLGGRAVSDPVGLLSVLRPNPLILIGHFFAVAIYAMHRTVTSYKIWHMHHGIYRSLNIFLKACKIIFPLIRHEISHH